MAAVAWASPASAQLGVRPDWNYADEAPQSYGEARRGAYDNGYREGVRDGERDARSRDRYDFRDERAWQRGDNGYHRSFGDRGRYQQSFRGGYEAGYADGYRRSDGSYGGGYGTRGPGGVYPNTRGDYGYGSPARPMGLGSSPAHATGERWVRKRREDARDRDSFDPRRHRWYRSGDPPTRAIRSEASVRGLYRRGFRRVTIAGFASGASTVGRGR